MLDMPTPIVIYGYPSIRGIIYANNTRHPFSGQKKFNEILLRLGVQESSISIITAHTEQHGCGILSVSAEDTKILELQYSQQLPAPSLRR